MPRVHDPLARADEELARIDAPQDLREENHRADLRWLMDARRGRRLVAGWLAEANVLGSTFDSNGTRMAYQEGRRAFAQQLLRSVLDVCPNQFLLMRQENEQ